MPSRLSVIALDDQQSDLNRLQDAFKDVQGLLVDLSGEDNAVDILNTALSFVREKAPTTIVLDLKWHSVGQFFDGFRFLRAACKRDLLRGVNVVIWSKYLEEAQPDIDNHKDLFLRAGVRDVNYVPKSRVPFLEEMVGER